MVIGSQMIFKHKLHSSERTTASDSVMVPLACGGGGGKKPFSVELDDCAPDDEGSIYCSMTHSVTWKFYYFREL